MELLTIILQMVVTLIECLLEFNEFLTLLRHFIIVAKAHIQLLVLYTLALLRQQIVHVLFEILPIFSLMHLVRRQRNQPLLLTVDEQVARFLKCNRMMTLRMINLVHLVLVDQLMLRVQLRLVRVLQNANFD